MGCFAECKYVVKADESTLPWQHCLEARQWDYWYPYLEGKIICTLLTNERKHSPNHGHIVRLFFCSSGDARSNPASAMIHVFPAEGGEMTPAVPGLFGLLMPFPHWNEMSESLECSNPKCTGVNFLQNGLWPRRNRRWKSVTDKILCPFSFPWPLLGCGLRDSLSEDKLWDELDTSVVSVYILWGSDAT